MIEPHSTSSLIFSRFNKGKSKFAGRKFLPFMNSIFSQTMTGVWLFLQDGKLNVN
jgi:hypothetical protein